MQVTYSGQQTHTPAIGKLQQFSQSKFSHPDFRFTFKVIDSFDLSHPFFFLAGEKIGKTLSFKRLWQ